MLCIGGFFFSRYIYPSCHLWGYSCGKYGIALQQNTIKLQKKVYRNSVLVTSAT